MNVFFYYLSIIEILIFLPITHSKVKAKHINYQFNNKPLVYLVNFFKLYYDCLSLLYKKFPKPNKIP